VAPFAVPLRDCGRGGSATIANGQTTIPVNHNPLRRGFREAEEDPTSKRIVGCFVGGRLSSDKDLKTFARAGIKKFDAQCDYLTTINISEPLWRCLTEY
jgi:hypothetical protein